MRRIPLDRRCYNCGTDKTYRKKRTGWACWNTHERKWYCRKCYVRLFSNPKYNPRTHEKWTKILNKRLIYFKEKQIYLKENPRKGICEKCKKKIGDEYINSYGKIARIKLTNIHHIRYDDKDPLKDTIELCRSCHTKESWRLGQYKLKQV